MKSILTELSKYILSIALFGATLIGFILFIVVGGLTTQEPEVLIGLIALFICSVLSLPIILERLGGMVALILAGLFVIIAGTLVFFNYKAVIGEVEFADRKETIEAQVIRDLKDIRTAQEEYVKLNGEYANDFGKLKNFIKTPVIPLPFVHGTPVSNNDTLLAKGEQVWQEYIIGMRDLEELELTLEQAKAQGYEIKDTTMVSLYELRFDEELRADQKLDPVDLDNLFVHPETGEEYIMKTGKTEINSTMRPWIKVLDPSPIYKAKEIADTLYFGAIDDPQTNGNWGSR